MSLTPDDTGAAEEVLISPEIVLESDRASLITGMAIARAWRDPAYRRRLLTSPRDVLTEGGLRIPESMDIRVFEDTDDVTHVSITRWTSEPGELAALFRGLLPLPEGTQLRVVQNSERAVCLVVPLPGREPEMLTDVERLRKLAPRASVFATADTIVASVATEFGEAAAAAAAATAHASTETETATATATAYGEVTISGMPTAQIVGPVSSVASTPGAAVYASMSTASLASQSAIASASTSSSASSSASASSSSSASADVSVSTNTIQVSEAVTFTEVDVSVVSEGASATLALEAEAAATTTTLAAEAEAVVVIVLT